MFELLPRAAQPHNPLRGCGDFARGAKSPDDSCAKRHWRVTCTHAKCRGGSWRAGLAPIARPFRAGARDTVRRNSSCKWPPPVVRLLVGRMNSKSSCSSSSGCADPLGCAAVMAQRPPAAILLRGKPTGAWSIDLRASNREPSAGRRRRSITNGRRALLAAPRCVRAWLVCRTRYSTRLPARGRPGRCREEPDAAPDRPRRRPHLAGVRSLRCPRAKDV
jgi:hypothetical protein